MDKAYITGNSPEHIGELLKREGLWLCVDQRDPHSMVPIISKGQKLYAMKPDQELSPDGFYPTVKFFGPFTPKDV